MSSLRTTGPVSQRSVRGFTLLELVAVVAVIAIFAALAIPATVAQLKNRRLYEAGRQLGLLYRQARMKAMGRGSAVLVRYQNNRFTIKEAVRTNAEGGCKNIPYSRCLENTWNDPTETRILGSFVAPEADIDLQLFDASESELTTLDICFSPKGRNFKRIIIGDNQPFTPLNEAYIARFKRTSGPSLPRKVVLMPNGTARMMTLGGP